MKTRILAAVVLVPLLLIVVLVAPTEVAAVIFGVMMALAAYELLYRTGLVRRSRMVIYSAIVKKKNFGPKKILIYHFFILVTE